MLLSFLPPQEVYVWAGIQSVYMLVVVALWPHGKTPILPIWQYGQPVNHH